MNPLDFLNTTNYPSSFLEGTFGDKFYSQSVEPAKLGTGPKPTLGQVAKNWNPLKAFTPKMLATGPTPAASKFLGSNIAYGLPFAYAGGADLLQDRLEKQGLTGEGGIYDISGGWGAMGAGADIPVIQKMLADRRATKKGMAEAAMQKQIQQAEAAQAAAAQAAAARQVRQNIQRYGGGDRPDTGMNAPGGGKGQSPTGGNVSGTPFNMGGLAYLLAYGGLV